MEQPIEKYYTFADVLEWDESVRAEIINGDLYMMSPPLRIHQEISRALFTKISIFLDDKPCKVYHAPFGVRLFETDKDAPDSVDTLVEPDITVVCDNNKLDKYGCKGAPDFIIEIISPSNARHDRFVKLNLYQRAKVREYWIVDPSNQTIEVCLPDENGKLSITEIYTRKDIAKVTVLPGCEIDLSKVFTEDID
ncbi:MAG: Uma2 family endonuclease [Eubacterium sp.]|nr:Uma2 family endonuclease [Eubacterium sp.]